MAKGSGRSAPMDPTPSPAHPARERATRVSALAHELAATALFAEIPPDAVAEILPCLRIRRASFEESERIYRQGDHVLALGIVLAGGVRIERTDVWGTTTVLGFVGPRGIFAESYACVPSEPLLVNAIAAKPDTQVVFVEVARVLGLCAQNCPAHSRLVANLVTLGARKNLMLSQRMFHTAPKTIRGKLLAYLGSEAERAGSRAFTIPYDRQQLANYLGVDRSALSAELSRMTRDGLLKTHRSRFELLDPSADQHVL